MDIPGIVYIGSFELPDKNAAAQRVISNSKLLRHLGYEVVLIGIDKQLIASKDINNTKKCHLGFESYALPYPRISFEWFKYIFSIKSYITILKKSKNLNSIICYNLPAGSLLLIFLYSRLRKIKIYSDCTEWYDTPKNASFLFKLIKKSDVYMRMQILHPKLDGVISISKFLFDFYKKKGAKTILVPPLVDLDELKWKNTQKSQARNLRLVYAGSPFSLRNKEAPKDRLDIFLKSLVRFKMEGFLFQMNVVGVKEDDLLTVFPQLKSPLDFLGESIIFHGIISHQSAIQILRESDFSIFVRSESIVTLAGFPTKFVESITCGVPVLTNNIGNISDFLIEGENGFWVDITNQDSVYTSLQKAFKLTPEKLLTMKEFCLQSGLFDYRKYSNTFKSFLS
jgi:glycosyltransferase involved in cell wall biosynthesis